MSGTRQRIGVLIDGSSRHREASRQSGEAIAAALTEGGHEARPVFVDRDLDLALRQGHTDVAFLALRGQQGSDGSVQGLLELLGIPYTGAGLLASALAMNQAKTHELLRLANLPTAPGYIIRAESPRSVLDHHGGFGFPVAVGPADVGLSRSTGIAHDEIELETAVDESFRFGDEVLVERFHDGRVIAVAVLDGEALGAADLGPRVAPAPGSGATEVAERRRRLNPARQPALLRMAERCCAALQVEGVALVELIVNERQNEVVRGVDVAPLLAPTSLYSRIAASAGLSFRDVVEIVLQGARLRSRGRMFDGEVGSRRTAPKGDRQSVAVRSGAVLTPGTGPTGGTCALPH
jgi:D-alanine-D-alanine ligase